MENRHIIINNALLSYATMGMGERALIFLHGWRSNKEAWTSVAACMEHAGYRLFFIDLPGFGASEILKKPYTLHDYAETVRMFIEKLNLKNCVIIGHSFGARVALKITARYPELAKKLVVVGSGGSRPWWRHVSMFVAKLMHPFFTPRFMQPLRARIYRAIGAEDYLATPALKQTFLNTINENLMPLCPFVQCETLVVWGENDREARLEYGRAMTRAIPNARLIIIADTGHFCFQDAPEEFVSLLTEFLNH